MLLEEAGSSPSLLRRLDCGLGLADETIVSLAPGPRRTEASNTTRSRVVRRLGRNKLSGCGWLSWAVEDSPDLLG